jgi:hypothetical protein
MDALWGSGTLGTLHQIELEPTPSGQGEEI